MATDPRQAFEDALIVDRVTLRFAMEHSSPEAMREYFREHPGADRKKHFVVKDHGEEGGTVSRGDVSTKVKPSKALATSIKKDWVGSGQDRPSNPVTGVMNKMERGEEVSNSYLQKAIIVLKNVESGSSKENAAKYKALRRQIQDHAKTA